MTVGDTATRPPATATRRLLGVVPAGTPALPGIEIVPHGSVAAAVAEHDDTRPVKELLEQHARLVERLFQATTVLPARYGMLLVDAEVARSRLLSPHEQGLARSLAEVQGRVEVLVRLLPDDTAAAQEAVDRDPQLRRDAAALRRAGAAAPHPLRVAVGERVARAVALIAEQDLAAVLARLEPLAVSVRAETQPGGGALMSAAYLVDRERLDELDAALGGLAGELAPRVELVAVGPLPPYSFADLQAG